MDSLPSLPDDILYTIATHTPYNTALTLLAARPNNGTLLRALYNPQSDFWHRRLGSYSGRGCLADATTGLPTQKALWTYKMQHDALVPREGHLILSDLPHSYADSASGEDRGIFTNVRVRRVICCSSAEIGRKSKLDQYGNVMPNIVLRYIIITECGELRYLVHKMNIDPDTDWKAETRSAAETPDKWLTPQFYLAGRSRPQVEPKMKVMVECDHDVVCLDHEGCLWLVPEANLLDPEAGRSVQAIELTLPSSLISTGPVLSITQITHTDMAYATGGGHNLDHAILLTLSTSSQECILFLHDMSLGERYDAIVPRFALVQPEVSALAHTWVRPILPDGHDKSAPIAPYGPYLIVRPIGGPVHMLTQHKYPRPNPLDDTEEIDYSESFHPHMAGDELFVIYSDDIVHRGGDDTLLITRSFRYHSQLIPSSLPPDDIRVATPEDLLDVVVSNMVHPPNRDASLDGDVAIPILPNWVMGRMGVSWGEAISTLFQTPTTTSSDNLGPYVWATCYNLCVAGPIVCLMPDGIVYELDPEDRVPKKVVAFDRDDEVRFLQVGWVHGGIEGVSGVGV